MIYLDSNATSMPAPEVVEAMERALRELWANPSSIHRMGQMVRREVELARESVAKLMGCGAREVVWTSGGTESANMCIRGSLLAQRGKRVVVTSKLEHSSGRNLAKALEQMAPAEAEVVWVGNDEQGVVNVVEIEEVLAKRGGEVGVVSIMWANNETGVIQPVERIGELCRRAGVRFHVDGVQWAGKMPMNVSAMPVDLMSVSAHKFHGPKGVGAVYVRKGVRVGPIVVGGTQERDLRAGTENVPGILGMGMAAQLAEAWLKTEERARMERLRDAFERGVRERVEEVVANSGGAARVWNTSNLGFARLEAEAILLLLSEKGVCASAGAACSSGSLEPSPVLLAMGIPAEIAHGSVRFSICRYTTEEEVERAVEIIGGVVEKLRRSMVGV